MTTSASAPEDQQTRAASAHAANPWPVLVIVCLAQFMVILDATIVNVALPSIQRGLHFSSDSLSWIINSYTLAFGGFLMLGGRAADLFGRQRVFMIGVVLFAGASFVNGIAQSSDILVIGRAAQGLGGALVSPAALSIITTTFSEGRERTKALGVWSAIAAGGAAFGLLLGGVLTEELNWRWIFFVNLPIGIATFVLAGRMVPNTTSDDAKRGVDVAGAVTVTAGLVALVYAIIGTKDYGWVSERTTLVAGLGVVMLAIFAAIELRFDPPLVRLGIFRTRSLTGSNLVFLLVAGGMFSVFFFSTLYVQEILGYTPIRAGFAFLPVTFGIGFGAGAAQQIIKRIDVRYVAMVGMTITAFALFLLSHIPVRGTYLHDLFPGLMSMSLGLGLTFVPITLIATTNVSDADAGIASGLLNTSQQIGGAVGLAALATFANTRTQSLLVTGVGPPSALVQGFQLAFVCGAWMMAMGVVLLALLVRSRDVRLVNQTNEQPVLTTA